MFKFKVEIIESERDWGSKVDEVKEFDTYDEAVSFIERFNDRNDQDQMPDWYMFARAVNFKIDATT